MPVSNSEHSGIAQRLWLTRALDITFFTIALLSLAYAVGTAPRNGFDFSVYYTEAGAWVAGSLGSEFLFPYPPFLVPVLAPMTLLPIDIARLFWLGINLCATAVCVTILFRYFENWSLRVKVYFTLLVLSWAPFRVTLRNGQLSLIITALILGAILARCRGKKYLAGVLLGLSLCKFTLSFPFVLYFLWKKEWKILATTALLTTSLTLVYVVRLGISLTQLINHYVLIFHELSASAEVTGSTEIKPLLMGLTGDNLSATILLAILLLAALISMAIAFYKHPESEPFHYSILSLFALWSVYHRTYDSVLFIIPVALLIDLLRRREAGTFSRFWLAATGLLILSLPGLLTSRRGVPADVLAQSVFGFLAVHIERLLTLGMFVSLLIFLWRMGTDVAQSKKADLTDNHVVLTETA